MKCWTYVKDICHMLNICLKTCVTHACVLRYMFIWYTYMIHMKYICIVQHMFNTCGEFGCVCFVATDELAPCCLELNVVVLHYVLTFNGSTVLICMYRYITTCKQHVYTNVCLTADSNLFES